MAAMVGLITTTASAAGNLVRVAAMAGLAAATTLAAGNVDPPAALVSTHKLYDVRGDLGHGGRLEQLVPRPGSPYYSKNRQLTRTMNHIKHEFAAMDPPRKIEIGKMARFPCRLFTLIDWAEWGVEFGVFRSGRRLLALFPSDPEIKFLHPGTVVETFVFGEKGRPKYWGDIHHPLSTFSQELPGLGAYDLVLFSQTLEHLYDPVLALKNLYDAMAPGGLLFTSVPVLNHLHMQPIFFSMPTPWGLAVWLDRAGFEILKIGAFGNEQYIHNLATHHTWWPGWWAYFNESRTPQIINDPLRPVNTWALVRKPSAPSAANR